jgi:hypothetical protein
VAAADAEFFRAIEQRRKRLPVRLNDDLGGALGRADSVAPAFVPVDAEKRHGFSPFLQKIDFVPIRPLPGR